MAAICARRPALQRQAEQVLLATIVNTEGCREVPSAPSSAAYDVDKPWHTVTSDAVRQGGHYYTRHAGRISGATSVGRECLSIGVCG
jgi:hypothetical protein